MDLGIKNRRALILGASKGLGYASARALAGEGVAVALSSSDLGRARTAGEKIAGETGATAVPLLGDVSNPDNMNVLAREAQQALGGPIDILVNNHGGPPLGAAMDLQETDLIEQFNKMVVSLIRLTGLLVPDMIAQHWGRIITIGSQGNIQPLPNMALSNTLRSAMVGYTKTLANEVIKDNVTVNIVAPGAVLTDRTRSSAEFNAKKRGITPEEILAEREQKLIGGKYGKPEDFGAMVAFLCSQYAGYCTGGIWRFDGGNIKSIV
ncbi:MAG: SDR family oxidoreductase [Rhodospirillales bacterium]|nr:SDR family oxidoreductase [Rhodospirillales bacterium]